MARGLRGVAAMLEPELQNESNLSKEQNFDRELALAAFRVAMGVNMFMHGAVRIFGHMNEFVSKTTEQFAPTILPAPLVQLYATSLPFIEFVLGGLLLIGLWTRWVLVAHLLLIASLTFGMSLLQNWSVVGSQVAYALAFFLLLFFNRPNRFSADWLLRRKT